MKFSLCVKSIEVRIYDGYDFCFKESHGLEEQVKQSMAMSFEQFNTFLDFKRTPGETLQQITEETKEDSKTESEDSQIIAGRKVSEDFFEPLEDPPVDDKLSFSDDNQGRVRQKKRSTKRYFQLLIQNIELTYLDLIGSEEGIDSQIGFTIEKVELNEIRSRNKTVRIFWFDNDLDSHKNIGLKIIFLENKQNTHEKYMEFYFMSESIRISISHLSLTFGFLLFQPISLFINNEMLKDEKLIEEVKKKSSQYNPLKSVSMKMIDEKIEGINDSVWQIDDKNLKKRTIVYLKYMHIYPFKIRVNYTSDNLNIMNLYKGELLSYLINVVDISNLSITIKERTIRDKILLEKAISKTIEFYLNDLIYNQNLNLLKSIYPIRVTINIMKAFVTLLRSPVNSYMNERYILVGVYHGFSSFLSQITTEFSDVGSKLLTYVNSWKNYINE